MEIVDFAIVGGGVAGLYAAYRLATDPSAANPTIAIFEHETRCGGRLLSYDMPDMPFIAELGGMRFKSSHRLFQALISRLGLRTSSFDVQDRSWFLRGTHLDQAAFARNETPYALAPHERGKSPAELVNQAIRIALSHLHIPSTGARFGQTDPNEVCRKFSVSRDDLNKKLNALRDGPAQIDFSVFTPAEWSVVKRACVIQRHGPDPNDARPIWHIGFWNLLQHFLSWEGFLLVHDGLGYESIVLNWNAAEAIPWFLTDFSNSKFLTVAGGMELVAKSLERALESPNVSIRVNHPVESLVRSGDVLELQIGGAASRVVQARKVILALPKVALERLGFGKLATRTARHPLSDQPDADDIDHHFDAVKPHPLFKLFLGYRRVWWNDLAIDGAAERRITDLPIRQVYYFGAGWHRTTEGMKSENAESGMVMASYSDAHYVDFWAPLADAVARSNYKDNSFIGYEAHPDLCRKAHLQLLSLHPLAKSDIIPEPICGLVRNWGEPPFYAGWHSWNPHCEPWNIRNVIRQPLPDQAIYVCGEAYSADQGWVEGALKSAELVLECLGLSTPEWTAPSTFSPFADLDEYLAF